MNFVIVTKWTRPKHYRRCDLSMMEQLGTCNVGFFNCSIIDGPHSNTANLVFWHGIFGIAIFVYFQKCVEIIFKRTKICKTHSPLKKLLHFQIKATVILFMGSYLKLQNWVFFLRLSWNWQKVHLDFFHECEYSPSVCIG